MIYFFPGLLGYGINFPDPIFLFLDEKCTLKEIVEKTLSDIREKGFEILDRIPSGEYVLSRKFELAGAINRLRSIRMRQE